MVNQEDLLQLQHPLQKQLNPQPQLYQLWMMGKNLLDPFLFL